MTASMGLEEDSKYVRHKQLIFGILAPNDTENNLNPDTGKELTMFAFSYLSRNCLAAGFLGVIRLKIRQKKFGVGCRFGEFGEFRIMCQILYQTICSELSTILPNNLTLTSRTCQNYPLPNLVASRFESAAAG